MQSHPPHQIHVTKLVMGLTNVLHLLNLKTRQTHRVARLRLKDATTKTIHHILHKNTLTMKRMMRMWGTRSIVIAAIETHSQYPHQLLFIHVNQLVSDIPPVVHQPVHPNQPQPLAAAITWPWTNYELSIDTQKVQRVYRICHRWAVDLFCLLSL